MSWLYERQSYPSERNGRIDCERRFGRWHVWVGGYEQTGPYYLPMWRDALRHVPAATHVRRVLLLGLGGGALIRPLRARFPDSRVTVVEWDPAMATVAERVGYYAPNEAPDVIIGDAAEIVPALRERFDLVIVDLFTGGRTASFLEDEAFVRALAARLEEQGVVLVNLYENESMLRVFETVLTRADLWQFRYNALGLFF